MKRYAAILSAALALLPGAALAQIYGSEISFFGTYDNVSDPVDHELSVLHLRYGRYLSDRALGTVGLSRTRFETGAGNTSSTAVTAGVKYYLGVQSPSTLVPFLDAGIGLARVDTGTQKDTDLTWELGGGAAYFTNEAVSVDLSLRWYNTDTDGGDTEGLRAFLGVTMRF